jgi:hypothetical protein
MGFRLRMILWIPTLAYAGFSLLGGKNLTSPGQVVRAAFLGALLGFLLAIMFTLRQHRRTETNLGEDAEASFIPGVERALGTALRPGRCLLDWRILVAGVGKAKPQS